MIMVMIPVSISEKISKKAKNWRGKLFDMFITLPCSGSLETISQFKNKGKQNQLAEKGEQWTGIMTLGCCNPPRLFDALLVSASTRRTSEPNQWTKPVNQAEPNRTGPRLSPKKKIFSPCPFPFPDAARSFVAKSKANFDRIGEELTKSESCFVFLSILAISVQSQFKVYKRWIPFVFCFFVKLFSHQK